MGRKKMVIAKPKRQAKMNNFFKKRGRSLLKKLWELTILGNTNTLLICFQKDEEHDLTKKGRKQKSRIEKPNYFDSTSFNGRINKNFWLPYINNSKDVLNVNNYLDYTKSQDENINRRKRSIPKTNTFNYVKYLIDENNGDKNLICNICKKTKLKEQTNEIISFTCSQCIKNNDCRFDLFSLIKLEKEKQFNKVNQLILDKINKEM